MTEKKQKKPHDQIKHNHREAFKGHKTRKHFLNSVHDEEAKEDIRNEKNKGAGIE